MKKAPKIIVSALIEKDGGYLLIKEVLESGKEYWILPGGGVEYGETLEEALKREIKEEVNLDIEILKFLHFKEHQRLEFDYHTIIFFFKVKSLHNNLILEDGKVLEAKFFAPKEIKNLRLVDTAKWLLKKVNIL